MSRSHSLVQLGSTLAVFIAVVASCGRVEDSRHNVMSELRPQELRGKHYANVRSMLIRQGWNPVPAPCSDVVICGKDVEFAYYLNENSVCGRFASGESTIRVCGRPIADGAIVESVALVPPAAGFSP